MIKFCKRENCVPMYKIDEGHNYMSCKSCLLSMVHWFANSYDATSSHFFLFLTRCSKLNYAKSAIESMVWITVSEISACSIN